MSPKLLRGALAALLLAAGTAAVLTVTAPASAAGTGTGYLRTSGNKIVDSTGATVRLTGINWFGMETDNKTFHGLWSSNPWRDQLDTMARLGYNTLRVPYSNDALKPGAVATGINDFVNPDLVGNSPLQILDKVIAYAGSKGMRVILDRHRPTAAGQTALWYTAAVPESTWINDWEMLARRYAGNPTVIGADLHNEPHAEGTNPNATGACWGCGDPARDWRLAAERAGNAILAVQPELADLRRGRELPERRPVERLGRRPEQRRGLRLVGRQPAPRPAQFPVRLNVANRLVYSPHDYAHVGLPPGLVRRPDFPANLPAIWDRYWGYLFQQNIAPIMLGEFGTTLADPKDRVWLEHLMAYLGTGVNGMSFTYWSWNPNSGDTGGIALDDWTTINTAKQAILQPYLIAPVGGGGPHRAGPRRPAGRRPGRPRRRRAAATPPTAASTPGRAASRAS